MCSIWLGGLLLNIPGASVHTFRWGGVLPATSSPVSYTHLFLLLLQFLLGTVLIVWVLGKVGGGFRISGNLRVFLFEFLLCFLEKYLLVLLIDRLTSVSYTHLDVYKRQRPACSAWSA